MNPEGQLVDVGEQLHSEQRRSIQRLAFAGLIGLVILLVIAQVVKRPTPLAYIVFRSLLALCVAAVAAELPGSFGFEFRPGVKAAGALAVFLFVFRFNPAALVVPDFKPDIDVSTGTIGRIYPIADCSGNNWLYVGADRFVRIGLEGTTTSLSPQSADVRVETKADASSMFVRTQAARVIVRHSISLPLPDGRVVGLTIDSVSGNNCTAFYSIFNSQ